MVALAVQRTLEAQHDVAVVNRAQDALDMLRAGQRFDVIFCDVMMPTLTGMELFDAVVRERPSLADRFVFITGGAFTERARLFLKQTGRPVLRKPCQRAELLEVVARIVATKVSASS